MRVSKDGMVLIAVCLMGLSSLAFTDSQGTIQNAPSVSALPGMPATTQAWNSAIEKLLNKLVS